MLLPMRPRPTIPNSMICLSGTQSLFDGMLQRRQARRNISAQVHAYRPALTFSEYLKIAPRLRRFHHTESVLLAGDRQILGVVASDLQKNSGVRAALVSLSRRVQEARSETQAGRHALRVTYFVPYILQPALMGSVHLYVGQERKIVAGRESLQVCAQHAG